MEAHAATLPATPRESVIARAWKWLRHNAVLIFGCLAIAYMLLPVGLIIVFSFNDPVGKFNFTWQGFTLEHWGNAFGIPELTDSLLLSLRLALFATVVSTVLGTMVALAMVRYNFFGRRASNYLIIIPTATPEVVLGASLLSMFLIYGLSLGFTTLFIAHVMFCISFVVIVVRSRLIGFDRSLEEAAQDLGASPFSTFLRVTLPLILPGVISGALLAFALSIDDFVVSNFTAGTSVTFPLYIYGAAQRGIPVEIYVIATILFSFTVLVMGFTVLQQRRGARLAAIGPQQEGE
jgi:spermidine/putrescine transport system permease protein